jgi:hypothetical protein
LNQIGELINNQSEPLLFFSEEIEKNFLEIFQGMNSKEFILEKISKSFTEHIYLLTEGTSNTEVIDRRELIGEVGKDKKVFPTLLLPHITMNSAFLLANFSFRKRNSSSLFTIQSFVIDFSNNSGE